jgi:uracil-DNA glycosylase
MSAFQSSLKKNNTLLVFPSKHKIFRAFDLCPLNKVKVVILSQDPYFSKPNEAQGIAFSVPKGIKIPPSLINIYKELQSDPEIKFIVPSHGDITSWAGQGILLLNTALTVRQGEPNSHMFYWETFTDNIIKYISDTKTEVVFILWGNYARLKKQTINASDNNHHILECSHCSPLSAYKGPDPFIGSRIFSKCNKILRSLDKTPINWQN